MSKSKCISVSEEFNDLSKQYKISWSEAARVGMAVILSDLGIVKYDNKLNKLRRTDLIRNELEQAKEKLNKEQATEDGFIKV